jgi:hypothetical protein
MNNICNSTIKSGPRKGLRCKYIAKYYIIIDNRKYYYCNKHKNTDFNFLKNNEEKIQKNKMFKIPNEIIYIIISYLNINDIIKCRLVNKSFLINCNKIIKKYINVDNILYTQKTYTYGYSDILYKVLKVCPKSLKITPLKLKNKTIINNKSHYNDGYPIYETYELEFDIFPENKNEIINVYNTINNNNIEFYCKNKNLGVFRIWNKEKLFLNIYYN